MARCVDVEEHGSYYQQSLIRSDLNLKIHHSHHQSTTIIYAGTCFNFAPHILHPQEKPMTNPSRDPLLSPELSIQPLIQQLDRLSRAVEALLPPTTMRTQKWVDAPAYRWERSVAHHAMSFLSPILQPSLIAFADLRNIDRQKALIEQNTRQFVAGYHANNVLLTGARGTGKSSLVKACLHAFKDEGLRLIEVGKDQLHEMPLIMHAIAGHPGRFIIFCDDLSFEEGETGYKELKTALDGSLSGPASNVLIYATSNRRHIVTEKSSDNRSYTMSDDGELHPGDAVEERISLSERFGLWITFHNFSQDQYLSAVEQWLLHFQFSIDEIQQARQEALQWALERGARSGRIAWQFACDMAGKKQRYAK